jgi:hypothetical protein
MAADAGPDGDAKMQGREADLLSDDAILRALATVRPDAGGGAPLLGGAVALEAVPEPVRGRPADVHTKPGRYPGYAVWFAPQKSGYSLVILWGLGTVPLPELESEGEEYWRVANAALRVAGVRSAYGTAGNGPCFAMPKRTIALLLDDFETSTPLFATLERGSHEGATWAKSYSSSGRGRAQDNTSDHFEGLVATDEARADRSPLRHWGDGKNSISSPGTLETRPPGVARTLRSLRPNGLGVGFLQGRRCRPPSLRASGLWRPDDGRTTLGFPTRRKEHRFKMSFASFRRPFRAKE